MRPKLRMQVGQEGKLVSRTACFPALGRSLIRGDPAGLGAAGRAVGKGGCRAYALQSQEAGLISFLTHKIRVVCVQRAGTPAGCQQSHWGPSHFICCSLRHKNSPSLLPSGINPLDRIKAYQCRAPPAEHNPRCYQQDHRARSGIRGQRSSLEVRQESSRGEGAPVFTAG